ncbi:MAG: hypothetical protein AAF434_14895 [Pseudomonadota bacterium]
MNLKRLRKAEAEFLFQFPRGFDDPAMLEIRKKHNVPKLIELSQSVFEPEDFSRPAFIVENLVKVVSRSSMISMFEKPKFRDFAKGLSSDERDFFVGGFQERLHGREQLGFEMMLDMMATRQLAKWSLISIAPFYFNPVDDVYVKPTTAKKIVEKLEIKELLYKPRPSWEFYQIFRERINEMKAKVDKSLSPNSAAFTGFLMMSL